MFLKVSTNFVFFQNDKKWAYLVYFFIFSRDFKILENFIANFSKNLVMLMLFLRFDKPSAPKNTNAICFEQEELFNNFLQHILLANQDKVLKTYFTLHCLFF